MKCQECGIELEKEEVVKFKVGRKTLKLCEECADIKREEMEVAAEAESVMQGMMEYKGR